MKKGNLELLVQQWRWSSKYDLEGLKKPIFLLLEQKKKNCPGAGWESQRENRGVTLRWESEKGLLCAPSYPEEMGKGCQGSAKEAQVSQSRVGRAQHPGGQESSQRPPPPCSVASGG